MAPTEPSQFGSSGRASDDPSPCFAPSMIPAPPCLYGPFDDTEAAFDYAPLSFSTIATELTPDDLDLLILEAMERGENLGDEVLQDLVRHGEGTPQPGPSYQPRTLTAKQFNSHKRSKNKRKKQQQKLAKVDEELEPRATVNNRGVGVVKGAIAGEGEGARLKEEAPRRRRQRKKGKQVRTSREEGKEVPEEGKEIGQPGEGFKGAGEEVGPSSGAPRGIKRGAEEDRLRPPKRNKTSPSSPPVAHPPRSLTSTMRRRHRHKTRMQATRLPGSGYWARDYTRAHVGKITSIKRFEFNMGGELKKGTQKGSYRPKTMKLDDDMKELSAATKSAIQEGTEESIVALMDLLVHEKGYRLFEWDGVNPTTLVDTEDRVFGVLVGQPPHPSWHQHCERLYELMLQDAPKFAALPKKNTQHRRGPYSSIDAGVTFAPGDQKPHTLRLERKERELLDQPEVKELKRRIQRFVETAFSLFAPRLYGYYTHHMHKLRTHPDYRDIDHGYPHSDPFGAFFNISQNSAPRAVTVPHRDVMNLAFGWCAVVALGRFDPQLGGHFIIHNLRLVFPFPPGSVILFPSAFLWHSNVPIRREDQRASITFYSAGGLFRFIDNSFMKEADLKKDDTKEYKRRQAEKKESAAFAAGLYSKASEIIHFRLPSSSLPAASPPSSPLSPPPSSPLSSPLSSPPLSPVLASGPELWTNGTGDLVDEWNVIPAIEGRPQRVRKAPVRFGGNEN